MQNNIDKFPRPFYINSKYAKKFSLKYFMNELFKKPVNAICRSGAQSCNDEITSFAFPTARARSRRRAKISSHHCKLLLHNNRENQLQFNKRNNCPLIYPLLYMHDWISMGKVNPFYDSCCGWKSIIRCMWLRLFYSIVVRQSADSAKFIRLA